MASGSAPVRTTTGVPLNDAAMEFLGLPFDALRLSYATGVQAGFIGRSMLASRDFERVLGALERCALGPLARSV